MKNITFEKYQGNGNDFVIIDSRGNELYKNYKTNKIFEITLFPLIEETEFYATKNQAKNM